jgi:hypothetical protein
VHTVGLAEVGLAEVGLAGDSGLLGPLEGLTRADGRDPVADPPFLSRVDGRGRDAGRRHQRCAGSSIRSAPRTGGCAGAGGRRAAPAPPAAGRRCSPRPTGSVTSVDAAEADDMAGRWLAERARRAARRQACTALALDGKTLNGSWAEVNTGSGKVRLFSAPGHREGCDRGHGRTEIREITTSSHVAAIDFPGCSKPSARCEGTWLWRLSPPESLNHCSACLFTATALPL